VSSPEASGDRDLVAVGMGMLELLEAPRAAPSRELWLASRGGEPGLVDLMKPVELALGQLGRPVNAADVAKCPVLYPDPVRITLDRGLWASAGASQTLYSSPLTQAMVDAGRAAPDAAAIEAQGGEVVTLGAGERKQTLVLMDRFAERPVHDLRALGFVLWSVFVRQAQLSSEHPGQLALVDAPELLLHHSPEKPLEAHGRVYDLVGQAPDASLKARLASQQRFLKAYRSSGTGLPRVLEHAARSFVAWASGRADVVPLGRAPTGHLLYRLPTGEELRLAVDGVET
jgi:hypothetical protein